MSLKNSLIKLGASHPELRDDLTPVIAYLEEGQSKTSTGNWINPGKPKFSDYVMQFESDLAEAVAKQLGTQLGGSALGNKMPLSASKSLKIEADPKGKRGVFATISQSEHERGETQIEQKQFGWRDADVRTIARWASSLI